jgi:N-glycosylase/DNA lyase
MEVPGPTTARFTVRDYNLAATLDSGQAFRWSCTGARWTGVVRGRWVCLTAGKDSIEATCAVPVADWSWLKTYLQVEVDLQEVLATFPSDPHLEAAVSACRGLRLLRQDPWECLASFILSSTKQIVQIRQMIALLSERFGQPVAVPPGQAPAYHFPGAAEIAQLEEPALRACKLGFRAPYLLQTARAVAADPTRLELSGLPMEAARQRLVDLPGVGRKIADCVLLFAYGFPRAFPVDVWVSRGLRALYFPRRAVSASRLHRFAAEYFGPHGGYAQQYLFHYLRTHSKPTTQVSPRAAAKTPL